MPTTPIRMAMAIELRHIAAASCLAGFLLAGCLAAPQPRLPRGGESAAISSTRVTAKPLPTVPPSAVPEPLYEKEPPEPAETAAVETDPPVAVAREEPRSLLARIDTTTRPSAAAALRLVEEGRLLLDQQSYDDALDRFERALTIDPSNAFAYYFLAQLHYREGGYDQAIAFADKAAVLSAHTDPVWAARSYAFQGAIFEEVGRYVDARAAYGRALAADGGNLAARVGMGRLSENGTLP